MDPENRTLLTLTFLRYRVNIQQQQQHFILHRTEYSFIKYRCKIEKKEYMYRKSDSGGKIIVVCKEAN